MMIVEELQACSALTALGSGFFWVRSARSKIPWSGIATLNGPARKTIEALNTQSRANAAAAWLAALSAVTAGLGEGVSIFVPHAN